jgi:hypothetical protein
MVLFLIERTKQTLERAKLTGFIKMYWVCLKGWIRQFANVPDRQAHYCRSIIFLKGEKKSTSLSPREKKINRS